MAQPFNCIIMGAAGRDFHDFQMFFRERPEFRVRAFTASQIPFIATRRFPRDLAGPHYDADIPIYPETELANLIQQFSVDFVFLAYSDLSHQDVMHKASVVQACGASFCLLGPKHTQIPCDKPVIAVTAVRTGAGKSPISQMLGLKLSQEGYHVAIMRHPMPYGDLTRQAVERFARIEDLDKYACTIEEREEFEPYLELGLAIYAGVDYQRIVTEASSKADVLLWDGGNNDSPFVRPGLLLVVVDALRPGHETTYYPGETNLRAADVMVINKVGHASPEALQDLRTRLRLCNSRAELIEGDLKITVSDANQIRGRRVLVVEDGPTLTHGGMAFGAGTLAARECQAAELIEPRDSAVGSIAQTLQQYPHLQRVLPALGYSSMQCDELSETIESSGAEAVVDASPARLDRCLRLSIPIVRVRYQFQQTSGTPLENLVFEFLRGTQG